MKSFIILGFLLLSLKAYSSEIGTDKNSNVNTNYCSPTIVLKEKTCKQKVINKTKIVYKTKVVNKIKTVVKVKKVVVIKKVYKKRKKNIIKGYLGRADTDVEYNKDNNTSKFKKGVVIGIGYQRFINKKDTIELNYLSNDTLVFGFGFGF